MQVPSSPFVCASHSEKVVPPRTFLARDWDSRGYIWHFRLTQSIVKVNSTPNPLITLFTWPPNFYIGIVYCFEILKGCFSNLMSMKYLSSVVKKRTRGFKKNQDSFYFFPLAMQYAIGFSPFGDRIISSWFSSYLNELALWYFIRMDRNTNKLLKNVRIFF